MSLLESIAEWGNVGTSGHIPKVPAPSSPGGGCRGQDLLYHQKMLVPGQFPFRGSWCYLADLTHINCLHMQKLFFLHLEYLSTHTETRLAFILLQKDSAPVSIKDFLSLY